MLVTEEPGPVQRMETGHCEPGCVTDVMQRGSGFQQVGIPAQEPPDLDRAGCHALAVCPPPRKRFT